MLPTDAAIRLHGPIDQALTLINRALQEHASFDPHVSERSFRIAMSDIAEVSILPRLTKILGLVAPLTRIDVVPLQPDTGASAMRSGEIDISIGHLNDLHDDCISVEAFNDRLICMIRRDHPFSERELTRESFNKLRFYHARMAAPIHQLVERWLVDSDAKPRIAVRGRLGLAPEIVRTTDLAAVIPEAVARGIYDPRDFRIFDLPFELPPIEVKVHIHSRFSSDMGIRWVRDVALEVLRQQYEECGLSREVSTSKS
jgi:DNA-binding transcriptional LysR family regulator